MKDISYYAVQLVAYSHDPSVPSVRFGTGCIIRQTGSDAFHYMLVSNRHVIHSFDNLTVKTCSGSFELKTPDYKPLCHPDGNIDLAMVCIDALAASGSPEAEDLIARAIPERNILKKPDVLCLNSATGIISASVPNHLGNGISSFPIVRRGIIATPPQITIAEDDVILADIACFPTYSGSPVFLESSLQDETPLLLGIEKHGPMLRDSFYIHMSILQSAYKLFDMLT